MLPRESMLRCCIESRRLSTAKLSKSYEASTSLQASQNNNNNKKNRRRSSRYLAKISFYFFPFLFFLLLTVVIGRFGRYYRHYRIDELYVVFEALQQTEKSARVFSLRYSLWFSLLLTCFIISSDCGCSIGKYLWMNLHNCEADEKKRNREKKASKWRRKRRKKSVEWIGKKHTTQTRESLQRDDVTLMKVFLSYFFSMLCVVFLPMICGRERVKWWTSHKREHRRRRAARNERTENLKTFWSRIWLASMMASFRVSVASMVGHTAHKIWWFRFQRAKTRKPQFHIVFTPSTIRAPAANNDNFREFRVVVKFFDGIWNFSHYSENFLICFLAFNFFFPTPISCTSQTLAYLIFSALANWKTFFLF